MDQRRTITRTGQIRKGRNGRIDLLKFLFSICIVLYHSKYLLGEELLMPGGNFSVDFFFLCSGYLLMNSVSKRPPYRGDGTLGTETRAFLLHKIKGFFVPMVLAWVIGYIITICCEQTNYPGLVGALDLLTDTIFEPMLITLSGLYFDNLDGVIWYLSAMILSMAVLYPLLRKFPDMMRKVICPVGMLFIYGYLNQTTGSIGSYRLWMGFFFKGFLRALADLSLGVVCFDLTASLRRHRPTHAGRILSEIVQDGCYLSLAIYMAVSSGGKKDFFFLILWAAAVCLSFSESGILSQRLNGTVTQTLGNFSLPLFLCNVYWGHSLPYVLPESWPAAFKISLYLLLSVATSFFVWKLTDKIMAHRRQIRSAVKSALMDDSAPK